LSRNLLCVYDIGSVPPRRIAAVAKSTGCNLVFVVPRNEHCESVIPILQVLGSVFRIDDASYEATIDSLRALGPDGILTFSEHQLLLTARLAEALSLPFHVPDAIPGLIQKGRQRELLSAAGIPGPKHVVLDEPDIGAVSAAALRYPVVVKPMVGAGSRNTTRADDERELEGYLREFLPNERVVVVEEMLQGRPQVAPWGDTVGIDCLVDGSAIETIFITGKFAYQPPFRESGGYGPDLILGEQEIAEIEDVARGAITALGLTFGVVGVELKLTAEGPRVIEVNGRLGAWVDDLAVRAEHNAPAEIAIKAALGIPWVAPSNPSNSGVAFNYVIYAPVSATTVAEVGPQDAIRRAAGVDQVQILKPAGSSVDWQLGSAGAVASVNGLVADHAELASLIDYLQQVDWIRYD
jgi:biotin carboxylase